MKALLSNVTGLPNAAARKDRRIQNRMAPPTKKCSGKFSKNWIRLFEELAFGDSLLN